MKNRKFRGVKGPRPDRKVLKQAEAISRQAAYDLLSVQEKLAKLPAVGAKRQCAKLGADGALPKR